MSSLFPLLAWELIEDQEADRALEAWGHYLGACERPFGRHSFGLLLHGELVAVAVSASTVGSRAADYDRQQVVELARLCTHPDHSDLTRVALRLWRKTAPDLWGAKYWPVVACVSYAQKDRHAGEVYRFDGWERVKDVRGGKVGPNGGHQAGKEYAPKSLWVYRLQ